MDTITFPWPFVLTNQKEDVGSGVFSFCFTAVRMLDSADWTSLFWFNNINTLLFSQLTTVNYLQKKSGWLIRIQVTKVIIRCILYQENVCCHISDYFLVLNGEQPYIPHRSQLSSGFGEGLCRGAPPRKY